MVDASINPLCRLPEGFTQLPNLQELYLNDTFLVSVGDCVCVCVYVYVCVCRGYLSALPFMTLVLSPFVNIFFIYISFFYIFFITMHCLVSAGVSAGQLWSAVPPPHPGAA